MTRISYAERDRIFGAPCTTANLQVVTTPWRMRVQVHRLIADVFLDACNHARAEVSEWNPKRIDHYACRTVRGSTTKSLHAYGLAFDFFATAPGVVPPGGVWTPDNAVPLAFARCFIERGFTWGATFTRKDVPHIEWAGGRPAARPAPVRPPPAPTLRRINQVEVDVILSDYELTIRTDENGNGWDTVPFTRARINGFTPPGLRPGVDGRYLAGQVGFADDTQGTVVSVMEWAPNAQAVVVLSVKN